MAHRPLAGAVFCQDPPVDLSRARLAVAASFATQGLVFISLTKRLSEFQDRWHPSELDLSLRFGFAVPMVLVLAMLPLAKAFAPSAPAPVAPTPTP